MYHDLAKTLREMAHAEAQTVISKRQMRYRLRHWQHAQKIFNKNKNNQICSRNTKQK